MFGEAINKIILASVGFIGYYYNIFSGAKRFNFRTNVFGVRFSNCPLLTSPGRGGNSPVKWQAPKRSCTPRFLNNRGQFALFHFR
jgi:hypothetical protein